MSTANGPKLRSYLEASGTPWLRWGARIFDITGFGLVAGLAIPWPQHISLELARLWAIPMLLLWIPVEAFFICEFGATPGKWLFGISVFHHDGSRLTFRTALQRSYLVFWIGMGAGLFAPFTQAWSFWQIAKYGETVWDRKYESVIAWHRNYFRAGLGAILLLAALHFVMSSWVAET